MGSDPLVEMQDTQVLIMEVRLRPKPKKNIYFWFLRTLIAAILTGGLSLITCAIVWAYTSFRDRRRRTRHNACLADLKRRELQPFSDADAKLMHIKDIDAPTWTLTWGAWMIFKLVAMIIDPSMDDVFEVFESVGDAVF